MYNGLGTKNGVDTNLNEDNVNPPLLKTNDRICWDWTFRVRHASIILHRSSFHPSRQILVKRNDAGIVNSSAL